MWIVGNKLNCNTYWTNENVFYVSDVYGRLAFKKIKKIVVPNLCFSAVFFYAYDTNNLVSSRNNFGIHLSENIGDELYPAASRGLLKLIIEWNCIIILFESSVGHCVCRNIKLKRIAAYDQAACICSFFFYSFYFCPNKINTFISSFQVLFWIVCAFISDIYSEVLWIPNCIFHILSLFYFIFSTATCTMYNATHYYQTGTYSVLPVHRIIAILLWSDVMECVSGAGILD